MKPFSLDLRALALWRMALGAVVLLDILLRVRDLQAFYGDHGVLSRSLCFRQGWQYGAYHLFLASGSTGGLLFLFLLWALAAFCLMIGYRPRIAGFITWYFVASIQLRNPMVMDGGDDLLRLLLFWTPFLPLGARWSWDARAHPEWAKLPNSYRSVATIGVYTQIVVLYLFAALLKNGDDWLKTGDALYMALSIEQFSTALGRRLLEYPDLSRWMTWGALVWEYVLAGLLLLGARWAWIRGPFCLLGLLFHGGIMMMFDFGIFMLIAMAGLTAFLPSGLLDRVAPQKEVGEEVKDLPSGYRLERPLQAFAAFMVVMIWIFNIYSIEHVQKVPPWSRPIMLLTYEQQHWHLFAPFPYREDGWFVLEVRKTDGTTIDAWETGPTVEGRPVNISARFANQRWRRWLQNLYQISDPAKEWWRQSTLEFAAREWTRLHPGEKVTRFRLIWMKEINTPPGVPTSEVEPVVLAERTGFEPERKPLSRAKGTSHE